MDPFLDRTAFPGPAIDLAASGASFAGQARFNGCIAVTNWLRAEVERLLPPQLALAANASPTPDIHPMIFVFGEQTQGAVIFARLPVPAGPDYGEFALAIPFVRHRHGRHLHVHVPRMYSSYFPATWNGNAHYGFGKAMARMEWRGPVFLMTNETDDLLLHAAVEPAGDWVSGAAADLPHLAALRAIFSLPVVGRKADGRLVCSWWGWEFGDALVRPADASVSIDAPLVEGLPVRTCADVPGGSFEVRGMAWKLTWPGLCRP